MCCIGPAVQLHISFMYEIMLVFFYREAKEGRHKGSNPDCRAEQCGAAAHMHNRAGPGVVGARSPGLGAQLHQQHTGQGGGVVEGGEGGSYPP